MPGVSPSENVILPHNVSVEVRGNSMVDVSSAKDMQATVTITSVYNETRGSGFHPFACWEYPDFFSGQRKKYPVGSKQKFELDCWTNSIPQPQEKKARSTASAWAFAQIAFDNDILWFNAPKEKCWFPDFVVQKDALYGPSFGNGVATTTAAAAPAKTSGAKGGGAKSTGIQFGPPWLRGGNGPPWMQGGGPPWMWWANFMGSGTGPTPEEDLRNKLRFCPAPIHQVGTFREQYNGQTFCYKCTRLDCENRPFSLESVDRSTELECHTTGSIVELDK